MPAYFKDMHFLLRIWNRDNRPNICPLSMLWESGLMTKDIQTYILFYYFYSGCMNPDCLTQKLCHIGGLYESWLFDHGFVVLKGYQNLGYLTKALLHRIVRIWIVWQRLCRIRVVSIWIVWPKLCRIGVVRIFIVWPRLCRIRVVRICIVWPKLCRIGVVRICIVWPKLCRIGAVRIHIVLPKLCRIKEL